MKTTTQYDYFGALSIKNCFYFCFHIKTNNINKVIDTKINKRYCQSCGMPLRFDVEEYLGTNADSTKSDTYCYYCLNEGKLVHVATMQEMVEIWVKYTDKYNTYSGSSYTPDELRMILNERLPTLSRWNQRLQTATIHQEQIAAITNYINQHLFEKLDTKLLSQMSRLSEFHFRRVFKSVTGENIAGYIQRLRIEHIAHLILTTKLTLEQICLQTNFQTKSSLVKAFRKHFRMSTSEYRKKYTQTPCNEQKESLNYKIKNINCMQVLALNMGDCYKNRQKYQAMWDYLLLTAKLERIDNEKNKIVSISLDDPLITPIEQCRFYLGIIIPQEMKPAVKFSILQIPARKYAVFTHTGSHALLHKLYQAIYEDWMPENGYYPESTLSFEIYLNSPKNTKSSELVTEVYIPIKKK